MSALRAGYIAPAVRLCPRLCRGLCFAAVGSKVKECRPWRHIFIRWCGAMNVGGKIKYVYGAGAPSAPSEEGAGAPKGFRGATEGERTCGCCLHQGVCAHKVIQVSLLFSARLYLLLSHTLGVSLLPSRRFNPLYAVPPPSSEGGKAAPATRHRISAVVHFYQDVCARRTHIYFLPKGQKI